MLLPEVVDPRDLVGGNIGAACPGHSCNGRNKVWRRNKWDQMSLQHINITVNINININMMMSRWKNTSSLESWAIGWLSEDHLGACNSYLHHHLHHQQSCKMLQISWIYIDNLDDWYSHFQESAWQRGQWGLCRKRWSLRSQSKAEHCLPSLFQPTIIQCWKGLVVSE